VDVVVLAESVHARCPILRCPTVPGWMLTRRRTHAETWRVTALQAMGTRAPIFWCGWFWFPVLLLLLCAKKGR